jgi:transcriptional regulator with GAF, ATPase, and Fis domain
MPKFLLKRLLSKQGPEGSLFDQLQGLAPEICILDADGAVLFGSTSSEPSERWPLRNGDSVIGWVAGDERALLVARLIERHISGEAVNAQLSDEVLGLYREINLLYKLSERLAASLDPDVVMAVALEEAHRIIRATSGAILLQSDKTSFFSSRKSFGSELNPTILYAWGEGLIGHLIQCGKGEIVNEVRFDPRYRSSDGTFSSLICAPLKANQEIIGLLILVSETPTVYTAADLKLMIALVSQAAAPIENALLHEKMLREAHEREEQLRRRIDELRIELDEVRQEQKVAELVETEYFQQLQRQSANLRQIMEGGT